MSNPVYGPNTATWPFFALPPPVPPTPPDFHLCHPFFGTDVVKLQCTQAAGRLPVGSQPISPDNPNRDSEAWRYPLPVTLTFGDCHVKVGVADSDGPSERHPLALATPDKIRELASWLITTCVDLSGLGGFGTVSLQNMINWVADDNVTGAEISHDPWPTHSLFYTVTVTKFPQLGDFTPAFDDPTVAEALADGVKRQGNVQRGKLLSAAALFMSPRATRHQQTPWWRFLDHESSPDTEEDSEMVYTCDAKLGAPSASDCSQLAYSKLGPAGDTITIGPGSSRTVTFQSCNVAISAVKGIVLTWAQISAGLSSLVDSCVEHPLRASRGGIAYPTNPMSIKASHGKKKKKKKRVDYRLTGVNALPPGVIIALFGAQPRFDAADAGKGLQTCKAAANKQQCFKTGT
ncbi:MAG: hypothetical protein Q9187_001138 [Circinaria calcarea]